jgi:subtilisin family serine protease
VSADGSGRVKPDVVAPGVGVLSAFPGGTYEYQEGTSMAGPHVAGAVALLWSAEPALIGNIDRTEQLLTATARPVEYNAGDCGDADATPNNVAGYGLIDVYAAVAWALDEAAD